MIFETIRKLIADQIDIDEDKITMDSYLREDLDIDSIEALDLILSISEEFEIEVPDEAVEEIKTVSDIVKYIEELQ